MRTFTQLQLVEFLKSSMSYSQASAEQMADLVFKARKPGSKDIRPRKKRTALDKQSRRVDRAILAELKWGSLKDYKHPKKEKKVKMGFLADVPWSSKNS
jgi:hypothetical protein